jgi:hypothetical protein
MTICEILLQFFGLRWLFAHLSARLPALENQAQNPAITDTITVLQPDPGQTTRKSASKFCSEFT